MPSVHSFMRARGCAPERAACGLVFSDCHSFVEPFRCIQVDQVLSSEFASRLLAWLEAAEEFRRHEDQLYRSSSFHLSPAAIAPALRESLSPAFLEELTRELERRFGRTFGDEFFLSANRQTAGDYTDIHNDYVEREDRDRFYFTHRFLIYLNRGASESDGGALELFGSEHVRDRVRRIIPAHNSGFGMAIGKRSHHAVSPIRGGVRYSLLFSFVASDLEYDV